MQNKTIAEITFEFDFEDKSLPLRNLLKAAELSLSEFNGVWEQLIAIDLGLA